MIKTHSAFILWTWAHGCYSGRMPFEINQLISYVKHYNFAPVLANYVSSAFSLLCSPEWYFNPLLVLVRYPWWNWLVMEPLRANEKGETMASLALEPVVTFQKCHWCLLQRHGAFFWCFSPAAGKKAEGWHKLSVLLCD